MWYTGNKRQGGERKLSIVIITIMIKQTRKSTIIHDTVVPKILPYLDLSIKL